MPTPGLEPALFKAKLAVSGAMDFKSNFELFRFKGLAPYLLENSIVRYTALYRPVPLYTDFIVPRLPRAGRDHEICVTKNFRAVVGLTLVRILKVSPRQPNARGSATLKTPRYASVRQ